MCSGEVSIARLEGMRNMHAAGWLSDPTGQHELRYWDGTTWTDHVSNAGTVAADPLPADQPPPPPPPPPSVTPPPPPPAGGAAAGGFMGKLKGLAQQATDQGRSMVDQAKASGSAQSDERRQKYADDPNTLWMGSGKHATGLSSAFYRITKDRIWIESGMFGSKSESVPLWAVKDMDVRQAMWQRGKDIGDVVLILEDASFGTSEAGLFDFKGLGSAAQHGTGGTGTVVLDNIESPHEVRELLTPLISEARRAKLMERQSQFIHYAGQPPAAPVPAAAPPHPTGSGGAVSIADELKKLGELKEAGLLTDEEFAAQKAKLLG